MYIYSFSNHAELVKEKLSDKKALLTKKFNRSDNFTNLVLLGAQKCVGDILLDKQSSVYLASRNGNLNTTYKVLDSIFIKEKLPMPFNFLNSVNSATLFFVAKSFNIEGKTLFVDRFDSALPQAFVDVKKGKTVLLGVVKEAIADLDFHKKRFREGEIEESSRWLILSSEIKGMNPLARIYDFKLTSSSHKDTSTADLFNFLDKGEGVFTFHGNNLYFKLEKV